MLIHHIQKQPLNAQVGQGGGHGVPGVANELKQPVKEGGVGMFPIDKVGRHVNEDRVHADDFEKEGPFYVSLYVDDVVKQRHQQQTYPTHI